MKLKSVISLLGLLASTVLLILKLAGLGDTTLLSWWAVFAPALVALALIFIPILWSAHQHAMEGIRHQRRMADIEATRKDLAKARLLR